CFYSVTYSYKPARRGRQGERQATLGRHVSGSAHDEHDGAAAAGPAARPVVRLLPAAVYAAPVDRLRPVRGGLLPRPGRLGGGADHGRARLPGPVPGQEHWA